MNKKKKIIVGIICFVCLISITGCGNKEKEAKKDSSSNSEIKDEVKDIVEVYLCKSVENDYFELTQHIKNEKVIKMDYVIKGVTNEDYYNIKEELSGYNGTTSEKQGSKLIIHFDLEEGAMDYINEEIGDFNPSYTVKENLTSYKFSDELFTCKLQK